METDFIHLEGVRVNNLKNITVDIPRNRFVVITGVSGSGKSSLAFDTLFAEGQRRYVESLSSYARQFLGKVTKPDVDKITGISPSIAIGQKVAISNPRSTVGTATEIYEYLKLLFARLGKTYSPISGKEVKQYTTEDVLDFISKLPPETRCYLCFKNIIDSESLVPRLELLQGQGYSRVLQVGDTVTVSDIEEVLGSTKLKNAVAKKKEILILVDRFSVKSLNDSGDLLRRMTDSVETAFYEGDGYCFLLTTDAEGKITTDKFTDKFEADGITFLPLTPELFSFNNPYGACPECGGFGKVIGIDEDLVIPDKTLSVYQNAVACWRGDKMQKWKDNLIENSGNANFPIHKPIYELSEKEYDLLWNGCEYFGGIKDFFDFVASNSYKIQYKVMASRFRGQTICPVCHGSRLRKEAEYVKFAGKTITELVSMPIKNLKKFFDEVQLEESENRVSERVLKEIRQRLSFLSEVGLDYLTLGRTSSSLSGGETQRINLSTAICSNLTGSLYVLDEPSVGLHTRDTLRLIGTLEKLKDLGNTVVVVEHDEEIIKAADYVIDIGPYAGRLGGEVVFAGTLDELMKADTLTAKYIRKELTVSIPKNFRKVKDIITVNGTTQFNLKNINVDFPLNMITVVTGVSGSGKTTLVRGILYPALKRALGLGSPEKPGQYHSLSGDICAISDVELVDQNPIGRSSRSNPVTYVGAFDDIRTLFAQQKLAKVRGYNAGNFSFNVPGGRCETCQGDGFITVEMQFLADVTVVCEDCGGKKYKPEILDIKYNDNTIYDVLEMTINQAVELFKIGNSALEQRIVEKIMPLKDVGLGYLKMGQPSSTLSGGEAQRVKLAGFLLKSDSETHKMLIFDEPTTGLHAHDIDKLMKSFNALVEKGNTIIIIEHNKDVIKCADYVIELGPEGGEEGGYLIKAGISE